MTPDEVVQALAERGVLTRARGGDLLHVLFWSIPDQQIYSAVVNRFTGDVLTVLHAVQPGSNRRSILRLEGPDDQPDKPWNGPARWGDIRFAILKAGQDVPDRFSVEAVELEKSSDEAAEPLKEDPLVEYTVLLRVLTNDGRPLSVRAGRQGRIAEVSEQAVEECLPYLFCGLVRRGLDLQSVQSIDVDVFPSTESEASTQNDHLNLRLMAQGRAGPLCINAYEAGRRLAESELE